MAQVVPQKRSGTTGREAWSNTADATERATEPGCSAPA
jgi:hypothetical protein